MEQLDRIHRRQLARLLDKLSEDGKLTPELERDLKRSFGFTFEDVEKMLQGQDKDSNYGREQQ